jgi:hypothetical protein
MENPSVPFMEHPFHPIRIKHLSDKVKSRIRNGHQVRISPMSVGMEGEGLPLMVHSNRLNNITKCIKQGKGLQVQLSPEELHHNKSVGGEGIFGKKFDRTLKKAGVKKLAYAVGSAVKPFAQKAITTLGQAGEAYLPGVSSLVAHTANDYLDRPEEYQKAFREEMRHKPTGNFKSKAIDLLADKIKEHTGEDVGVMDKAGASKAMADRMSAELAKRVGTARAEGSGLYAGRGLGLGLGMGMRRREYHSVGGRHTMMGQGVPALVSQPYGVNYQFRAFLPPAYQHLHK